MKTFAFSKAHVSPNGELCLRVDNIPMARQLVLEMKGKPYIAEVKEYRRKRTKCSPSAACGNGRVPHG